MLDKAQDVGDPQLASERRAVALRGGGPGGSAVKSGQDMTRLVRPEGCDAMTRRPYDGG